MRCFLLFLLLSMVAVWAEDWKTTDGTVYEKVKVLSHDDAFVTIMYADGGARVPLRLLPPDLQARFGYDPAKAGATEAATKARDAADRAAVLAREQQQARQQAAATATPAASANAVPAATTAAAAPAAGSGPPFDGGLVRNGDFSRGDQDWEGDGMTPLNYARFMRRSTLSPEMTKGLIVPLNQSAWTKVFQLLQDNSVTKYTVKLSYRAVPGTTLSKAPEDYKEYYKKVNVVGFENFTTFSDPVGALYCLMGDTSQNRMSGEFFFPVLTGAIQKYEHTYPAVPPNGRNTFVVTIPPGNGAIVILSVNVTGTQP